MKLRVSKKVAKNVTDQQIYKRILELESKYDNLSEDEVVVLNALKVVHRFYV